MWPLNILFLHKYLQDLILLLSPYICTHTNTQLKCQDAVYLDFFSQKMIQFSNAR